MKLRKYLEQFDFHILLDIEAEVILMLNFINFINNTML